MKNLYERQFFSQLTDGTGPTGPGAGSPPPPQSTGLEINLPDKWYDKLPEEYKAEESLKNITDFNSLVKSYVHAQKLVGAEKIPVPGKFSTDDDWKAVYSKLGLPKDVSQYNFDVPKDVEFQEEFVKGFKEIAHKNGILPKQAAGLMGWFGESMKQTQQKSETKIQQDNEAGINSLKQEWGNAFGDKISLARLAVNKLGDEKLKDFLEQSKLGDNPTMIRLFANIGNFLKEEKHVDLGTAGNFQGSLTPADAQKKLQSYLGEQNGPYYNAEHPNHKAVVAEVQELFKSAYPT